MAGSAPTVRELIDFLAGGPAGGRMANSPVSMGSGALLRLAPLADSKSGDVAFFFSKNYRAELPTARPSLLVTGEPFVEALAASGLPLWKETVVVACRDPYLAMALVSERFAELNSTVGHVCGSTLAEIHPSAVVDSTATLGARARVGAHCVIEAGASIGEGTVLYPGCYVGPGARIGADCVLFPRVSIYERVEVGNRVRLHAGVVLGADGFGYAPGPAHRPDASGASHYKIYHFGRVVIGDEVEIGANSTVDRGTLADTIVGPGSKIDNLCHLGHNARLGRDAILCGGTFLAGNASVGDLVYVGGMSGISNQVRVGDGAKVGAMSLLTKDVAPGETVAGNPQRTYREHFRAHAALNKLIQKPKQEP